MRFHSTLTLATLLLTATPLRMTEYGVKPPSLMLGTLKVADAVTVHFDVVLEK